MSIPNLRIQNLKCPQIINFLSPNMIPQVENSITKKHCFIHEIVRYCIKLPSGYMSREQINFMFRVGSHPNICKYSKITSLKIPNLKHLLVLIIANKGY